MAHTVADIMERDVVTVAPDDDVESLIGLLRKHELPGVPVTEGDQHLVGIVTRVDCLAALSGDE